MTSFDLRTAMDNLELVEKLTFTRPPSPEEKISQIKLAERTSVFALVRDSVISLFALTCVSFFVVYCFQILNNINASPDDKKWAMSVITLVISGVIGYLVGKVTK